MNDSRGMVLDRVVLLGRTYPEYAAYFDLDADKLRDWRILDVASGVSSFTAEARDRGLDATACDPIYATEPEIIAQKCRADLEHVCRIFPEVESKYTWSYYGNLARMTECRERAYRRFLDDFKIHRERYLHGAFPRLPFRDGSFDLVLVSYLLFLYEDQLDLEFHRAALKEALRVTSRECRIYPLVTFDAKRSRHLDSLKADAEFREFRFEEVPVEFEFLKGSNVYLKISPRSVLPGGKK
jgi:hypothetical protein